MADSRNGEGKPQDKPKQFILQEVRWLTETRQKNSGEILMKIKRNKRQAILALVDIILQYLKHCRCFKFMNNYYY
jgi:hypothetical protein